MGGSSQAPSFPMAALRHINSLFSLLATIMLFRPHLGGLADPPLFFSFFFFFLFFCCCLVARRSRYVDNGFRMYVLP